ncbi:MAG: GIY-YIG nuclease family protein, partial [Oscillospiraceae bacterium]|nr:GIY-YIG nuclease family protein [Oscillospiraceae bacterium]
RPDANPMIYAYEESNPDYKGLLKVGYTTVNVEQRVAQQYPTKPSCPSQLRAIYICRGRRSGQ